jgi:hypothetical protein
MTQTRSPTLPGNNNILNLRRVSYTFPDRSRFAPIGATIQGHPQGFPMTVTTTTTRHNETDALLQRVLRGLHGTNPQAAANLEYDLAQDDTAPAQTFTVTARGETITFESTLSDPKVLETLRGMRNSFAQDLARKWSKLSASQYAWAHKLAQDNVKVAPEVAPVKSNQPSPFDELFATFERAKSKGAKRLSLRFQGINVKPNEDNTCLWVTSQTETEMGKWGLKPKYLGRVTPTGCDSRLSDTVKEIIMGAANDPLTAVIRYGKVSGRCSCCGVELDNPKSIERGIGPICATKFGW